MNRLVASAVSIFIAVVIGSCSGSAPGTDERSGSSACDAIDAMEVTTRIAAVGDTGTGSIDQQRVADLIEARDTDAEFDALLILGDMIYEEGDPALIDSRILQPYAETLDGPTRLLPVIGNHDIRLNRADEIMATLGAPGRWYSYRVGPVLVVVLDSTRPNDATQRAWFEAELDGADDRFIIAAMHHPPYSAGYHGSNIAMRNAYKALFEINGVDLVLAGHDHDYQRSKAMHDITYVVSGAGAQLRDTGTKSFTVVAERALHFLEIEMTDDVLEATAIGVDGIVDQFTICHDDSNLN